MRNYLSLLLLLWSTLSLAGAPSAAAVDIVGAEFGLFETSADSGETAFTPATVVPLRAGQRYGWVIEVRKAPRSLSVREEYVSPEAPQAAEDPASDRFKVMLPRRNLIGQRQLAPVGGKIYGEWSVGPNEPAGHRHLEVLVEGRLAASFDFDVE